MQAANDQQSLLVVQLHLQGKCRERVTQMGCNEKRSMGDERVKECLLSGNKENKSLRLRWLTKGKSQSEEGHSHRDSTLGEYRYYGNLWTICEVALIALSNLQCRDNKDVCVFKISFTSEQMPITG